MVLSSTDPPILACETSYHPLVLAFTGACQIADSPGDTPTMVSSTSSWTTYKHQRVSGGALPRVLQRIKGYDVQETLASIIGNIPEEDMMQKRAWKQQLSNACVCRHASAYVLYDPSRNNQRTETFVW